MKKATVLVVAVVITLSVLLGSMMFIVGNTDDVDAIINSYNNTDYIIKRPISVDEVRREVRKVNEESVIEADSSSFDYSNVYEPVVPGTVTGSNPNSPTNQNTNTSSPNVSIPSNWLGIADACHKVFGSNGLKYVYGGTATIKESSGNTIKVRQDCSGYVGYCLYKAGYISDPNGITSSSVGKLNFLKEVDKNNPQPGDILVYSGHVEIYAGNDRVYNWGSSASAQDKYKNVTNVDSVDTTINWSRKGKQTHAYRFK